MIKAEIHTDDYKREADFDATVFFQEASDDAIIALADIGFRGDYPADDVAFHVRNLAGFENVAGVLDYTEEGKRMPNGDQVGFEVVIDPDDAMNWLSENKPELAETIRQKLDGAEPSASSM